MGIVGDKDIIMRVVKCTDPNRINNSASIWLGYIFCIECTQKKGTGKFI